MGGEFFSLLTPDSSPLAGMRVLLVDDETDTRELTAFMLEQCGAIVTSVSSAIEALRTFPQVKPDVLVSDIGMPEMDGYMLVRQIRVMSPNGQIPAVALTAYAGESDRASALAAGFQCRLAKPIEPAEIVTTVARLCGRKETDA